MNRRLQDLLVQSADRAPESAAIVFQGEKTSYAELEQASNRLARALRDGGCVRGDRIALLVPKSPEALTAMFAALKADCIYVPLDTSSPTARLGRAAGRGARRGGALPPQPSGFLWRGAHRIPEPGIRPGPHSVHFRIDRRAERRGDHALQRAALYRLGGSLLRHPRRR